MTIATKLIQASLQKIRAHSVANPASSEDLSDCMFELNAMLQEWESQGIAMGIVPVTSPSQEIGEPPDATLAIINNLAIQLAPDYPNGNVTPELRENAKKTFDTLRSLRQKITIPRKGVSSTMPMGQGNKYAGRFTRSNVFAGKDAKIDG